MFLETTDENKVTKVFNELKNKKTPGNDGNSREFIKSISLHIAGPQTNIINKCISHGIRSQIFGKLL